MTTCTGLEKINADTLRLRRSDGTTTDLDAKLTELDDDITEANTIATDTAGVGEVELVSGNQLRVLGPGLTTSVNLFGNKINLDVDSSYPTTTVIPALLTDLGVSNTGAIVTSANIDTAMLQAASTGIPATRFVMEDTLTTTFLAASMAAKGYIIDDPNIGSTWWEGIRLRPTLNPSYPNAEAYLHLSNTYTGSATLNCGQWIDLRRNGATMLRCQSTGTIVYGDFNCTGTFTAGVKNFSIPYPGKTGKRIIHSCLEGRLPGVYYRFREVECTQGANEFLLPEYYELITKNGMVMSSPVGHFGLSHGSIEGNTVRLITSKAGKYNVLVMADRADKCCDGFTDVIDEPEEDPE